MVCFVCNKHFVRGKKGVSCSICSNRYHATCGGISDALLVEIGNGTSEWKCPNCRQRSTRRSIIIAANDKNTNKPNSSNLSVRVSTPTSQSPEIAKLESTMSQINAQLQQLKKGQQSSINTIQNMADQMSAFQNLTATVKAQEKRIQKVDEKTNRIDAQVQSITKRMDRMEQSLTNNACIQINGIPCYPDEDSHSIVMELASVISSVIKREDIRTITRTKPHQQSIPIVQTASHNNDEVPSANTVSITPLLATFVSEDVKNQFLSCYRKKRLIFTDDIGIASCNQDIKQRIFIFEHLIPSLKKIYIKAKSFQKANKYKYLWTKNGNIFLRKGDKTKIIRVFEHTDLSKLEHESHESNDDNPIRDGNVNGNINEVSVVQDDGGGDRLG